MKSSSTRNSALAEIGLVDQDHYPSVFSEFDTDFSLREVVYPETISQPEVYYSALRDSIDDFLLSRHSLNCSTSTIEWYTYLLGRIATFLEFIGVNHPTELTKRHVDLLLADLRAQGRADSYIHQFARVLKTFTGFLFNEGYINEKITITMPIVRRKRQRVYSIEEMRKILKACNDERDRAFILFMVASGVRLAEVLALNWVDVNMKNGLVRIENGKGGKFRTAVIGVETRRALYRYKSKISSLPTDPVFQTQQGTRLTESGLRSWMTRLSNRAGVHIVPHALRRTFATISTRAGINLFQLQALLGHSTLDMTRQYVTLLDEDLIEAHENHNPVSLILGR